MIEPRAGKDGKTRYRVRVGHNKKTLGTFDTKRIARQEEAKWELSQQLPSSATTYGGHGDHWAAADEIAHYTHMRKWTRRAQRVAAGLKRLERRGWVEANNPWGDFKSYRTVERIRKAIA